jgi:hypothetical protein
MASGLPEVLALTRCKLVKRLRSKPSATASISASYKLGSGLARTILVKALVIWIWKPTELKLLIEIHCAPNDQDAEKRPKNHDFRITVPGLWLSFGIFCGYLMILIACRLSLCEISSEWKRKPRTTRRITRRHRTKSCRATAHGILYGGYRAFAKTVVSLSPDL